MSMHLNELSVASIQKSLKNKDFSCQELTQSYLNKVKQENDTFHAFLRSYDESALTQAKAVDAKIANQEELSPLAGIPIALKDNILDKDQLCTAGSQFLKTYKAQYSAHVTHKLRESDAVILGKTNMDEFAMGSSNENSSFADVKNPWDLSRVPGGSSGGSAAAVAQSQTCLALGTDTGGSVRQPASFCGITSLKPTYGRISRYGVIGFASSLDQVGPFGKTVQDVAFTYETIAGFDAKDSKSLQREVESCASDLGKNESLKGKTIGYCPDFFPEGVASQVKDNCFASIKKFEALGATIKEIKLPNIKYGVSCYYVLAPAEASANLARFDGIRYTQRSQENSSIENLISASRSEFFGDEVCRRILMGTFVLSSGFYDAFYLKALKVRKLIQRDFLQAFKEVDHIITPTAPTTAFKLGDHSKDPLQLYLADMYTVPVSMAGLPALSLPSGLSEEKLPFGVQLIGNYYTEKQLFETAHVFEKDINFKPLSA